MSIAHGERGGGIGAQGRGLHGREEAAGDQGEGGRAWVEAGADLAAALGVGEQFGDQADHRLRVALVDHRGEAGRLGEDLEQGGVVELG